jgi:hypothetical protein
MWNDWSGITTVMNFQGITQWARPLGGKYKEIITDGNSARETLKRKET